MCDLKFILIQRWGERKKKLLFSAAFFWFLFYIGAGGPNVHKQNPSSNSRLNTCGIQVDKTKTNEEGCGRFTAPSLTTGRIPGKACTEILTVVGLITWSAEHSTDTDDSAHSRRRTIETGLTQDLAEDKAKSRYIGIMISPACSSYPVQIAWCTSIALPNSGEFVD